MASYKFREFYPKPHIVPNFFSDEDILEVERMFRQYSDIRIEVEAMYRRMSHGAQDSNVSECRSHYWYPGKSIEQRLIDFVMNKIRPLYGEELWCQNWHILNAFSPYNIHSDSYDRDDHDATILPEGWDYAYTFLIPLADYNTHTFVFNEVSNFSKVPQIWAKEINAPVLNYFTEEDREKYFSHESEENLQYFSLNLKFPWKKGDLLVMARHSFHCSDNFPAKGVLEKRALIGWSYWKYPKHV